MGRRQHITGKMRQMAILVCAAMLWASPAIAQQSDDQPDPGQMDAQDGPGPIDGPDVPDDEWIDDEDDDEEPEDLLPAPGLEVPEGADDAFRAQIEEYNAAYERYAGMVDTYRGALENLVETEFKRRMAEIDEAFSPRIREAQAIEDRRREEAIGSLQAFIEEYPQDPDHTPDALFRLALLYDQQEEAEYQEALADYFERFNELEQRQQDDEDVDDEAYEQLGEAPQRSYADSRGAFEQLIADWPDYHGLDLAYYFLAHMEWERGDWAQAREYAGQLIEHDPDSRFVAHAWLMIGEFYFEEADRDGPGQIRDNLQQALRAFDGAISEQAREQLSDDNYVRALYSWAWTHYRLEDFPKALNGFREVVYLIDVLARETGEQRDLLREDAIGHLAEIMAMEDWDLDGVADPMDYAVMPRIEEYMSEGDDFERDVLAQLGEQLYDYLRFDEAIEVFEYVIELDPMHPDNPQLHGKIVASLHRDYREEEAFAVRREMIDYYGENSSWHEHQQRVGNEGAIREAENMVRDYLLMAATWYHDQAQTQRNEAMVAQDESLLALTEEKYAIAADAYEEFLRHYPEDSEIFQWTFYYAETLYYAGKYDDAYEQYRVVRELDIPDNPFQEVSAFNAIQALEFMMRRQVREGELTPVAVGGADMEQAREAAEEVGQQREVGDDTSLEQIDVDGQPIPAIVKDYITAMDRYVVLGLENEQDQYLGAKFAFQGGQVYHNFRHFDVSRERFAWIVDNYPDHEVGYLAGSLILESFRQENDFESLTEWAERLEGVIEGEQAEAVREEVRQYRLQGMFRAAEEMLADEEYDRAAEEFIRLAREAPDHTLAPRALNNAAAVYEINGDFHQAIEQYENLFRDYPDHDLAPRAVYRVAVNSEWLFDYDKSVRHYQLYYDQFRGPTPEGLQALDFDIENQREDALLQAAQMNEYLQRYPEAARRYEEFFETYPESEYATDTLWAAAQAWEKAERYDEMVRVFDQYIDEFGDQPEHKARKIEAWHSIAELREDRGRVADADEMYEQILDTVAEWMEEEQMPPGEGDILSSAAEAQFVLTERDFHEWDDITIEGTVAQQERRLNARLDGMDELLDDYQEVFRYNDLEWTMAAYFRIANTLDRMAQALFAIPNPFEEGSEEYWYYQDQMDDRAFPLEDQAVQAYERTIQEAREREIVNEWTEAALEALHEFQPDNYPFFEDEKRPAGDLIDYGVPMLNDQMYQQRRERDDVTDDEELDAFDTTGAGGENDPDDDQDDDGEDDES